MQGDDTWIIYDLLDIVMYISIASTKLHYQEQCHKILIDQDQEMLNNRKQADFQLTALIETVRIYHVPRM